MVLRVSGVRECECGGVRVELEGSELIAGRWGRGERDWDRTW